MAKIVVHINNIAGASEAHGYAGNLDAVAINETLEIAPSAADAATDAKHTDVMLTRVRDRASPKLAEACAAGTALGDVTIRLYRGSGTDLDVYMTYVLKEAYVSRYEWDTADEHGGAYMPHFGPPGQPLAQPVYGVSSVVAAPETDRARLSPRPLVAHLRGVSGRAHVERVWINSSQVEWTHTRGGTSFKKSYNHKTGQAY